MMNQRWSALLPLLGTLLSGCATTRPDPTDIKKSLDQSINEQQQSAMRQSLPAEVEAELMPTITGFESAQAHAQEQRLDINANKVPAALFFPSLVKGTHLNCIVHPDVTGEITLTLSQATLEDIFSQLSDLYGYEIRKQGNTYHIYPAEMRIETIALNYLMMQRQGASRTTITSGGLSDQDNNNNNNSDDNNDNQNNSSQNSSRRLNGTRIETRTNTDYWQELQQVLSSLIGNSKGRKVLVSPQAGLVTVQAYPDEIRTIREYLKQAENHLQRQVVLEAKILEVNLSDDYQQGIDWNTTKQLKGTTTNLTFNSISQLAENTILSTIGGGGALTIASGNFDAVINLLDTQGDVNVLSSPRITASNNQRAVIKVGTDEYFVTDISSTTVSSTTTVTNPSVELTPFFSGIALDVTPQINEIGEVILHVHPSVTSVTEQRKEIVFGSSADNEGLDIPLAKSDIRESDTIVKARTGDVVVIGGLMRSYQKELVSKTPFIGDIPIIGELFTNRQQVTQKTELVILLKPTLVSQATWSKELERSRQLLEEWYPSDDKQQDETAPQE